MGGGALSAEESLKLESTIISATGFEQDADSNIRNVIVLEGEELKSRGYLSLKQALQRVAGISFVNSGAGEVIDMRGQGDKANVAVKLMLDGKNMNLLDSTVAVTPIDAININDIDRIEIIPGGGSVLYGNGTRGGVINIITKKNKQTQASFSLRENAFDNGNFGTNAGLDMAMKLRENIAFSLNVQGFNEKGYRQDDEKEGFNQHSKLYIDLENSYLNLGFSYYKIDDTSTGTITKEELEADRRARGATLNTIAITRPSFDVNYHLYLNDKLEFDALAFWQKQRMRYKDNPAQEGSEFSDTLRSINIKGSYKDNSYLVFGYDLSEQKNTRDLIQRQNPNPLISVFVNTKADMQKQSHSFFALNSYAFNDNFSLSAGARYEYADYKSSRSSLSQISMNGIPVPSSPSAFSIPNHSDNNFAFELTPNFKYSDTGQVYAKYERAFISPNPSQFTNRASTPPLYPYYFADLDSEIFDTFELGLSDFLWNILGFNMTLFYTKTKDEIVQFGPGFTQWWQNANIDETKRLGVELGLWQSFFDDTLFLRQGLSYLDNEISKGVNEGLEIPYVSKLKATASAEYIFHKNLQGFVDLTYFSKAKDEGRIIDSNTGQIADMNDIKEYFLVDLGLNYTYKAWEILAGVKNVFDEEYYSYQNAISNNYIVGNGRSYYLGFDYKF